MINRLIKLITNAADLKEEIDLSEKENKALEKADKLLKNETESKNKLLEADEESSQLKKRNVKKAE